MADHVVDLLSRCRHIVEIEQADINTTLFPDDSTVRNVIDVMMDEALQYKMQYRKRKSHYVV